MKKIIITLAIAAMSFTATANSKNRYDRDGIKHDIRGQDRERAITMRNIVNLAGYRCNNVEGSRVTVISGHFELVCDYGRSKFLFKQVGGRMVLEVVR